MAKRSVRAWASTALRANFDGPRLVVGVRRHLTYLFLGIGIALRLGTYLVDRPFWMDEATLSGNLAGERPLLDRGQPLGGTQLAPPGFLVVERIAARTLGESRLALRLFPLACGIGSLFLFLGLARGCLDVRAVPLAMALFAVSPDLIYFSSELKQYSVDVAAALGAYAIVLGYRDPDARFGRLLGLGLAGLVLVWFSHPSALVLGGAGGTIILLKLVARDWRRAAILATSAVGWALSFAACYRVSRAQLADESSMSAFWYFSFLPFPPTSLDEAYRVVLHLLDLFVNPLMLATPFGLKASALLAAGLFLLGAASLWRGKRVWFYLLLSPILLAMTASGLRAYPFHGRTLLFLVPALYLVVVEGLEWLGNRTGRGQAYAGLVALLVLSPLLLDLHAFVEPPVRNFDPHGDLRRKQFS